MLAFKLRRERKSTLEGENSLEVMVRAGSGTVVSSINEQVVLIA